MPAVVRIGNVAFVPSSIAAVWVVRPWHVVLSLYGSGWKVVILLASGAEKTLRSWPEGDLGEWDEFDAKYEPKAQAFYERVLQAIELQRDEVSVAT